MNINLTFSDGTPLEKGKQVEIVDEIMSLSGLYTFDYTGEISDIREEDGEYYVTLDFAPKDPSTGRKEEIRWETLEEWYQQWKIELSDD